MNSTRLASTISAGLGAATALLIEHYAFQRGERKLEPPVTYILGVATLGTAFTWWAQRHDMDEAALAFWAIAPLIVRNFVLLRMLMRKMALAP